MASEDAVKNNMANEIRREKTESKGLENQSPNNQHSIRFTSNSFELTRVPESHENYPPQQERPEGPDSREALRGNHQTC